MKYVLKDLIAISKDGEWGKGEPFDESVEMLAIRGTDFEDIRFGSAESTPRRHIARRHAERKVLQPWDVVIEAAGGTKNQITGRTVLLRPQLFARSELPFTCASFSRFIRFNADLCDPAFMFWYLQYLYTSGLMHAYHTQHTGVARFQWTTFSEREPLDLPPLPIQRRIAGILSAYDELIENSQRRIKILESMARAIYREWFVRFRFPGHEPVPFAPSSLGEIPTGWEVRKIAEFADFTRGFEPGSNAYENEPSDGRIRFLRVGDLSKRESGLYIAEHLSGGRVLQPRDIAITLDGSVGEVRLGLEGAYSSGIRRVDVKDKGRLGWVFAYQLLLSDPIQATIQAHAKGTTIKHAGTAVAALAFVSPPRQLIDRFEAAAAPIMLQVLGLQKQVDNLRRTRDLLLPRLLSGQIDVEAITS